MPTRCYVDPSDWPDQSDRSDRELRLSPDESHHLLHVLRASVGDRVTAFDGQGREAVCVIESSAGRIAGLRVLESSRKTRPGAEITLAQALMKGQRMDWMIEKATELGAARIVPIEAERSVVRLRGDERVERRRRWQKIAVSAAKQCGSAWLPEVTAVQTPEEFLAGRAATDLFLLCDLGEAAQPLKRVLAEAAARGVRSVTALVGPEGDFTAAEKEAARAAGAMPVSLGALTLRAETAALFILAVLACDL
ncbi:MAG: 16S rRNA (uracil(1498)-N(3))-methyltransferase [Kiritimatiellae bacterium]|nr:16S rRNA (uracil(1498)-N(3))-methyltransferase [Kiritimatiellia bacterium]